MWKATEVYLAVLGQTQVQANMSSVAMIGDASGKQHLTVTAGPQFRTVHSVLTLCVAVPVFPPYGLVFTSFPRRFVSFPIVFCIVHSLLYYVSLLCYLLHSV